MADFDMIRDKTLLFFLDHLMGKGQSRTLHDLSCQFGAKGFTKEMRQIAGGSQSGLKKFLSQFPSLFTIDGDNVYITPLTSTKSGSPTRDYTKETVEFFTDKMVTYGVAEVPLKSLFGHRSQATSEIRHVSGQNVKEFSEFLASHSNIFVMRDDYVVLKSVLDQLEQDGQNESQLKRMPEESTFDPYLMQQLITELEDTLFTLTEQYSNMISIDFLFNAIQSKDKLPLLWNNFVKVPSDLITFLHMNSRLFLVQGNMVSLTVERKQALIDKKSVHSYVEEYKPNGNVECRPLSANKRDNVERLKEDCKPCEADVLVPSQKIPPPTTTTAAGKSHSSLNQRLRSQIIKIVSDNLQYDSQQQQNHQIHNSNSVDSIDSSNQHGDLLYDSLDLQVIKPKVVVTNRECNDIVEDIFENCTEVAFDLEGINLGPTGEVTLIQLAFIYQKDFLKYSERHTIIPKIYFFDVLLNRNLLDNGLKKLFESDTIIKICHDVRNNSVSLNKNYGITLKNVFDTQVAHLILQQQCTGKPAYKPTKYISLYSLCQLYGGPNLNPKMKDKLHKIYKKDFKYWQKRPLTDEMMQFAITDVYALLPTIYRTMSGQIRGEYKPLFNQLVYESIFSYIHTEEIKQLKRQRKFELEVTDLKLKLFNSDKKKIVLSNREIRLLRYIDITDEVRNKIEGPQNVAKKLKRFEKKPNGGDINDNANPDDCNLDLSNRIQTPTNKNSSKHYSDQSDDEVADDDFDLYDDIGGYDEEETETESINSSLKSHENDTKTMNYLIKSCCCHCHQRINGNGETTDNNQHIKSRTTNTADMFTQTLSTGDIVITKIHLNES